MTLQPVSDFAEGDPLSPSFSQKKPLPAIEDDGEAKIGEYSDPSQNPFAFIQAVKSGSADFLEFVYLRPRVMGKGEKSPYNLEVVPSSAVTRDDYYTLGLSGASIPLAACCCLMLLSNSCYTRFIHLLRYRCDALLTRQGGVHPIGALAARVPPPWQVLTRFRRDATLVANLILCRSEGCCTFHFSASIVAGSLTSCGTSRPAK